MKVNRDIKGEVTYFTMLRPSNFHAHLRLENLLYAIAYRIMWAVKYLLVMPNDGLVDTIDKLVKRYECLTRLAEKLEVNPTFIMTLYLTENVTPYVIERLALLPFKVEVKYYPTAKGATTGSGHGIPLADAWETLKMMAACGTTLLIHGETVHDKHGRELPHEDRETYFMENEFRTFRDKNPDVLVSIEHASTAAAIQRVKEDTSGKTVLTFTPHHLTMTINELKRLSWANHGKCMPIPKGPEDVYACRKFATSGDKRASAGDDTAAHRSKTKEGSFDSATNGAFWTEHGIAAYARVFENEGALDSRFEQFMSLNGVEWRSLEPPEANDLITLRRETKHDIPGPITIPKEDDVVIPLGWSEENDRLRIGFVVEN